MKTTLLVFFTALFANVLSAQLVVEPDLSFESVDISSNDIVFYYDLELQGMDSVWVHWELINGDDMPAEWSNWLCDNISCYQASSRNNASGAFKINRFQESIPWEWALHLDPAMTDGSGSLTINTYYLDYTTANHTPLDFSDVEYDGDTLGVSSHTINIKMGTSVSVEDIDLSAVSIYPNPTSDFFQVKSDEYVKTIGVYNVVGKLVEKMDHTIGQTHNIEHIKKGMYLVRLMSEGGQVIKTMKLSKR